MTGRRDHLRFARRGDTALLDRAPDPADPDRFAPWFADIPERDLRRVWVALIAEWLVARRDPDGKAIIEALLVVQTRLCPHHRSRLPDRVRKRRY